MDKIQEIDELFRVKKPDENPGDNDEVLKAHKEILALQKGDKKPILTGVSHLDEFLIGGITNKMIFIGSRPSQGKTYSCDEIIGGLVDEKLNPGPVEIFRFNWEMSTQALLLRELKKTLGKKMKDIVQNEYTEAEKILVKKSVGKLRHKRIKNYSKILEGRDFEHAVDTFMKSGDPEADKIMLIDHIHILGKKERIDNFLTICNEMKLKYKKLSFIFYFQLNRILEKLWRGDTESKANPKNFRPNSSHILQTDNLFQYADLIMTLVIPQVVGLDEYAAVYRKRYDYLSEHIIDNGGDWGRLKGYNRIYYDYIKVRMNDDFDDPRLFCSILDKSKEDGYDGVREMISLPSTEPKPKAKLDMPIFINDQQIMKNLKKDEEPNF